ncbi:EscV/YscV/HrcV family type III secretion system export apparatus protein [Salmonella enterica]|nr:EscV/YscV/HrcV family type III secretion system export apparatus protein [Salmonella enterica]EHG4041483.1 EscV/YscV/HrcV family type III secretion system export apparatus protein [Salmonella enterica]EHG6848591.1 EscV/YscV/HrcV family type III secretion system export apparatus protein [Salmonella enterica]
MGYKILRSSQSHPELIILLLMVVIISMMVIPLPTYLLDFLIGLNMILSILVFMSSFYVDRILGFSSFPSVLIITTLFRLALSISTSRLILLESDAGEIINSFGQFVIGDNLAVGFVVFAIVTTVQFIVITKGSERVAEVTARFSLDGMPGKQMSIDADLRAGIIDADTAKQNRSVLEKESQLYGSFDGAMKFIKGDAIANIVIIFVNIIGGLSVGIGQQDMDFSSALSVYTILTIGDGLVSQIPALLIAISAGFIVTRVSGENDNMGKSIISQLLRNPFVLVVTCILALCIGLLPGFPLPVFIFLSSVIGIYWYLKFYWRGKKVQVASVSGVEDIASRAPFDNDTDSMGLLDNLDSIITETVPLVLIASKHLVNKLVELRLTEYIRNQFFLEYGIRIPPFVIRPGENMDETELVLLLNEVRADQFSMHFDMCHVVNFDEDALVAMGIEFTNDIRNGEKYYWVSAADAKKLSPLGYQMRSGMDELYNVLSVFLAHNISEFFGIQETKYILEQLEIKYPDLLKEVLRYVTIQRIAEVIQRLIKERISVRNMRLIMESLAQWAPREKDIIVLVEHVRSTMARYISHKFSYSGEIKSVVVSKEIEDRIRSGVRPTAAGTFLNLEPSETEEIIEKFKVSLETISVPMKEIVLLTSVDIRRFVKKFIETYYQELEVISYGELTEAVSVNVIKTV